MSLKLKSFRKGKGLTQQQAATALELKSKGYYSRLESGKDPMPIKLALRIQRWSGGEVKAEDICPKLADELGASADHQAAP